MALLAFEAGSESVVAAAGASTGTASFTGLAGTTAGTAVVGVTGWQAGKLVFGDDPTTWPGYGSPALDGWVGNPDSPTIAEVTTGQGQYFRATVEVRDAGNDWAVTVTRYHGTGLQTLGGMWYTKDQNPGEGIWWDATPSGDFGPTGSDTATRTRLLPKNLTALTVSGDDSISTWYPPTRSERPVDGTAPAAGSARRYINCVDQSGQVTTVTASSQMRAAAGASWDVAELRCPAGSVVQSFGADWLPRDGTTSSTIIPETETQDWVRDIPSKYPECVDTACYLELWDAHSNSYCGDLALACADWYVSPDRASGFRCLWGSYEVALSICSVFRDPGRLLPNAWVGSDGAMQAVDWPALELSTQVVARATGRLTDRYGTDACAALGEGVRPRVPATSIPDAVLVCEHLGISTALQWILRVSPDHLAPLVEALVESADGQPITIFEPDCNQLSADGRCLDEEGPESEPEPQPDPSGSGVRPPPNCLDDVGRQQLIDAMDEEAHHMATHYGLWGSRFQAIASKYGLNVKTGAWNLHPMPHAGPHPWNYHNWVMRRMQAADAVAQQFPVAEQSAVFLAEFQRNVTEVVLQDPTVVRAAYWKCRDYYKWR